MKRIGKKEIDDLNRPVDLSKAPRPIKISEESLLPLCISETGSNEEPIDTFILAVSVEFRDSSTKPSAITLAICDYKSQTMVHSRYIRESYLIEEMRSKMRTEPETNGDAKK